MDLMTPPPHTHTRLASRPGLSCQTSRWADDDDDSSGSGRKRDGKKKKKKKKRKDKKKDKKKRKRGESVGAEVSGFKK